MSSTAGKRTRGPSQRITKEVYAAALTVLQRSGIRGLSMEAIADQAGVHKTTLYRRWGSVNELIKSAIADVDMGEPAFRDTGSLKTDLQYFARQFTIHYTRPEIVAFSRLVAATEGGELQSLIEEYWGERNALFLSLYERAKTRGESFAEAHFPLALESIIGPILLRILMTKMPVDQDYADQLSAVAYAILTNDITC